MTSVAEGVENAETALKLREYGCEVVQGFHYSPPVSAEEILELLLVDRGLAMSRPEPASVILS
jgi:EAL domain-containing protein (putative c-di-GMP-specific phosphodiesterase class I)